jgi:hypothetical protein
VILASARLRRCGGRLPRCGLSVDTRDSCSLPFCADAEWVT